MVPLGPEHVVFQEGDVLSHHLDKGLAERGGPGCHSCPDWSTFLAAERPDSQSLPPAARGGQAYLAGRPPSGILTITATAPLLTRLGQAPPVSSHILHIGTLLLASVLQRRETKAQRGWVTCPKSRSSLQASLSARPLHQLSPCCSALLSVLDGMNAAHFQALDGRSPPQRGLP